MVRRACQLIRNSQPCGGGRHLSLVVMFVFVTLSTLCSQNPEQALGAVVNSDASAAAASISKAKTSFTRTFTKPQPDAPVNYKAEAAKMQIVAAENSVHQAQEYERQATAFASSNPSYAESLRKTASDKYRDAQGWVQKASSTMGEPEKPAAASPVRRQTAPNACRQACQQLVRIASESGAATRADIATLKLPDFEDRSNPRLPAGGQPVAQTNFFRAAATVTSEHGREVLQLPHGNKVELSAIDSAVRAVSPELANQPVLTRCGDGKCANPKLMQVLADPAKREAIDKVGGVALAATFDLLAISGYPEFRAHGNVAVTNRPTLLSLKALLKAVTPYADDTRWSKLPDELRFPGNLSRVKGYVFDEANDDLIIVGIEAEDAASRLDIDILTTSIREVWRDGKVMGVSLDPRPDKIGGAQYPRLINVPDKSVVAKIMLDADYAMKQVTANAGWAANAGFLDWAQIYAADSCAAGGGLSRFWLTPQFLSRDSIYSSSSDRTMLLETTVEVQTEQLMIGNDDLIGTGGRGNEDTAIAHSFTDRLPRYEADSRIQPPEIFRRLHGVFDLGTLATIWRNKYPRSATLRQFSELPVRALSQDDSYPAVYPGVHGKIGVNGCRITVEGGVHLDLREGALAGTEYQDRIAALLESAAIGMSAGNKVMAKVDIFFAFAKADPGEAGDRENALVLSVNNALAASDYEKAEQGYRALIQLNPGEPQSYAGLAQLELFRGGPKKAVPWAMIAMHLAPNDERVQLLGLDIGWRLNPNELENSYSPVQREELSRLYARTAEDYRVAGVAEKAKQFADWATELWEDNGYAYWTLAMLSDEDSLSRTALFIRAADGFRAELKAGHNEVKGALAETLAILAERRLEAAENLLEFRVTGVLKRTELSDSMIVGFLADAAANANEALTYEDQFVDAAALKIEIQAVQHEYDYNQHKGAVDKSVAGLVTEAEELCKKFPKSANVLKTLSFVQQVDQAIELSVQSLNLAITIEPADAKLLLNRARLEAASGNCSAAIADIEAAKLIAGQGAADADFKAQLQFGPDNKCAAEGVQ